MPTKKKTNANVLEYYQQNKSKLRLQPFLYNNAYWCWHPGSKQLNMLVRVAGAENMEVLYVKELAQEQFRVHKSLAAAKAAIAGMEATISEQAVRIAELTNAVDDGKATQDQNMERNRMLSAELYEVKVERSRIVAQHTKDLQHASNDLTKARENADLNKRFWLGTAKERDALKKALLNQLTIAGQVAAMVQNGDNVLPDTFRF